MNNNILDKKYLKGLSKNELIRLLIERDTIQTEKINQLESLVQSLQSLVQTLQLEIQSLKKDSSNSSKPPSSDMNRSQKNQ